MPKIVEIVAPSGTGKSTLYKSLQREWEPNKNWGVYHDIRYKRKPGFRPPSDYLFWGRKKLNSWKGSEEPAQYENFNPNKKVNERTFYQNHVHFCDVAIELIHENSKSGFDGSDKRYLNTFFLFETIEHLQAILNRQNDDRICLMDEGLLSRVMHINSPTFGEQELRKYIEPMPLPDAAIYLHCSPEIIADRIQNREKISTVHKGLKEDEILSTTKDTQNLMEKMLAIISEKGVDVYKVDASKDTAELTKDVLNLLEHKLQ